MHPTSTKLNTSQVVVSRSRMTRITQREKQVLNLIAHEHSSKEIAEKLFVSHETVNSHRKNMMDKLGVRNAAGLVRVAFERGLMRVGQVAMIALICILISKPSSAQQLTGLNYNYEVQATSGYFNSSGDESGDEHIVWLVAACHDTNNATTEVIPSYSSSGVSTCSGQIYCDNKKEDFESGRTHNWSDVKILNTSNKSDTEFDLHYRAWESDNGGGCTWQSGDDERCSVRNRYHAINYADPNKWSSNQTMTGSAVNGNDGSNVKFKVAWRYNKGTKNDPIDFGVVNGTEWHYNSNRSAPSGADSNIGYTDEYNNGDNDVTYKFEIKDQAKNVRLSTNFGQTNYNTYLQLRQGGSQIASNNDISSSNNKSEINRVLCPGVYTLVVEGNGASGDFAIQVHTTAYTFSAGTISSSTNQTTACKGNKIETINGTSVPSLHGNSPSYQWKVWDAANSEYVNVPTGTNTSKNLSNYGDMEEETLYFRRYATICGVEVSTDFHRITYQASSVTAGTIHYYLDDQISDPITPIRQNFNASPVDYIWSNNNDIANSEATGDPSPLTYRWEKRGASEVTWSSAGSSNSFIYIDPLSESTFFRRVAINGCGLDSISDPVNIPVLPAVGEITGFVTAPPAGIGTGIANVEVCATPIGDLDGALKECVITSNESGEKGKYTISNLYFGANGLEYEVQAKLVDHVIIVPPDPNNPSDNDSTVTVELNASHPSPLFDVNFIDTTVYQLSGNVSQIFEGTKYGKMDVKITLKDVNNIVQDTVRTSSTGDYSVIVPNAGVFKIIPELIIKPGVVSNEDHDFDFPMKEITVLSSVENVDFIDLSTNQIDIDLPPICDLKVGSIKVKVTDEETETGATNGFDKEFTIPQNTGMLTLLVPARNYKVDVLEGTLMNVGFGLNAADIEAQFTDLANYSTDLTFKDTAISVVYKAPPSIEFLGLPDLLSCPNGEPFQTPIINQLEEYPNFKIKVWEGPKENQCPQDTGFVKLIENNVERSGSFPISKGDVKNFRLIGGNPNLIAPHIQTLNVKAQSLDVNNPKTETQEFIVSGVVSKGKSFFGKSPNIPLLILRDPPTDEGYAFHKKETSTAFRFKTFAKTSNIDDSWASLKVGADVSISNGIGAEVGYNAAGWVNPGEQTFGTTSNTSATETDMTINFSQDYETDRVLTGEDGDLFVYGVINFIYSKTEGVLIDSNLCTVKLDTSIAIAADSISSIAHRTTAGLRNDITELKSNKLIDRGSDEPKGDLFWDRQIKAFEDMIARNQTLKQEAIAGDTTRALDINGGIAYMESQTYDTLRTNSHEYLLEVEDAMLFEGGFEIAGSGLSGGTYVALRTENTPISPSEAHKNTDTIEQVSITTGFQLLDNETNDKFLVGIYKDKEYGTPVFDLLGARSSCPYEIWDPLDPTSQTDPFEVSPLADFPVQRVGIDPDAGVQFKFVIKNTGLFKAGYIVKPDLAYNENGAIIRVNGSNEDRIIIDSLNAGQEQVIGFTVKQDAAVNFFNHKVRMNVFAYCSYNFQPIEDPTNKKFLDFSVTFDSDCSRIDIVTPTPYEIVNTNNEGSVKVQMRNYDKSKMNRYFLQYKALGAQLWSSSTTFDYPATALFDDAAGTIQYWALPPNLADGKYDIRITTVCEGGLASGSDIIPITIDQTKPEVFGIPSPIDDVYSQQENDQISVSFDENVKMTSVTEALIKDLITGDTIQGAQIMVDIYDNIVIVTPQFDLGTRAPSLYRVILSGISDLNGNMADSYRWLFSVGDFDFALASCLEDLYVSNNNFIQDAISASTYNAIRISSNGIVSNETNVTYKAQEEINLEPGFAVGVGGVLDALIETCGEE